MEFTLMEISGLSQAWAALKQSKRHYDRKEHDRMMQLIHKHTDYRGFLKTVVSQLNAAVQSGDITQDEYDSFMHHDMTWVGDDKAIGKKLERYASEEKMLLAEFDKCAKWGAGVGQGDKGVTIDAGHETLLRFIDFTFSVEGLHRGAMDDLDAHAKRFDNRIVRSSTRFDGAYQQSERSDWYKGKILSVEEALASLDVLAPREVTIDGAVYVKVPNGYALKSECNNGDVLRGNYPMSIPMNAILKINLVDLRHVYMRRNIFTTASPELQLGIEQLANQIETFLPCDLGRLIRYDYALNPETGVHELAHIMSIRKTVDVTSHAHNAWPCEWPREGN